MASTGPTATGPSGFKLDEAVATPSSEWAEATRAALEDKTAPIGSGTSTTTAAPGGTAPVIPSSSTLPTGASSTTAPGTSSTTTAPQISGVPIAVDPQTPGLNVPGAYPSPHEAIPDGPVDTSAIAQDVNNMVQEARERLPAQEDLQQAAQDMAQTATNFAHAAAGYLPKSIGDAVAGMLPTAQASENDAIHAKSLPTQETHGAQPGEKVGGVGALPGSVDEAAVAKLPGDDAAIGLPEGMAPTLGAAALAGAAGYQASANDVSHDKSLPTQETHGAQAGDKVAGAGALPGAVNETGVAKLPGDDAATGLPKGSAGAAIGAVVATSATAAAATSAAPPSTSTSSNFKVPARPEDMVAKSHIWPDARSHGDTSKSAAPGAGSTGVTPVGANDKDGAGKKDILIPVAKGEGGKVPSADATLPPAKREAVGKDATTDDKVQGASLDAAHGKSKPSDVHSQSGTSAHTQDSKGEKKHKASFMEKVKGEIKVISGKLGGDKHKVEDGKKLKSGEV
ncbi:hypothetical protein PENSPDRAFT_654961 [Peniophora sp. CONT]|nr:hypothetical protein PENSPDRAFT_654961 [Peniophora sp. CONT]